MKKHITILTVMAVLLLAALASSPISANNGKGEVIAVTGIVLGKDLMVHIIALVPPGANRSDVAKEVLANQGARAITKEEFSTISITWDQFSDGVGGNDMVDQYYNTANQPAGDGQVQLTNSQTTWNNIKTSNFAFNDAGTTSRCPSLVKECQGPQTFDGFNDVGWMSVKGCCTLGVTWTGTSTDEADMALNTDFNWDAFGGDYDVETVFLHENGHVLGLAHSGELGAVMEAVYAGERRLLTQDDIDGVTYKYPAPGAIALAITTTSLPDGTANSAYSATLSATGGTGSYSWSIAVELPGDMSLDTATGEISGTPQELWNGNLNVTVTDEASGIDTTMVTLTINAEPVAGSVTVTSIDYRGTGGKNKNVHLLIDVRLNVAVADALVSVMVYRDGGIYGSATGATDSNGVAHSGRRALREVATQPQLLA